MADLPDHLREVTAAVDVAGMTYAEAATALRIPAGTVMSRLYRARERLVGAVADRLTPPLISNNTATITDHRDPRLTAALRLRRTASTASSSTAAHGRAAPTCSTAPSPPATA